MSDTRKAWMVSVETLVGISRSADELEQIALALERDERASGPSVSLNLESGCLAATLGIDAATDRDAAYTAFAAVMDALIAGGAQLPERVALVGEVSSEDEVDVVNELERQVDRFRLSLERESALA